MNEYVAVDHSRFVRAQRSVFTSRVEPDCMSHSCSQRKLGDTIRLDACCQYGADADVSERDGILAHAGQIRGLLRGEVRDLPWFHEEVTRDLDFTSGQYVRTRTHNDGCIFLAHDLRGCSIHRASVEGGWDYHGIKPNVCRLYPLSYESDAIILSNDYADYSCSQAASAPSVYRVARNTVGAVFGDKLVLALDEAEARVLATTPGRTPSVCCPTG